MSCLPPFAARLRLPLIAAPMFLVSGPALVTAACRAGVIGSFPTANCRTSTSSIAGWPTSRQRPQALRPSAPT